MRVMLLSSTLESGGLQRYLIAEARGLVERGHVVSVGYSGTVTAQLPWLEAIGVRVDRITERVIDARYLPRWVRILRGLVRELEPDVIHAHTATAGLAAAIAAPHTPLVVTVHGKLDGKERRDALMLRATRARVTVVSQVLADDLARYPGCPPLEVVPGGLDVEAFAALAAAPLPPLPGSPALLCVARHEPVKGVDVLVRALPAIRAALPDAVLTLVGTGSETAALRAQAAALDAGEALRFAGDVADPAPYIAAADIVVLPSRYEGGLSLAVLEALALARPVVATRVGGVPGAIQDGRTGVLVEPESPAALAAAIASLAADPERACALGERGRELVGRSFSATALVDRLEGIFADELARRAPSAPRFDGRVYSLAARTHGTLRLRLARDRRGPWRGVRLLGYHRITAERDPLAVHPARFRAQIEAVLELGYEPSTLDDALDALDAGEERQRVVVTFDDGFHDNLDHAFPILAELDVPAIVYVPVAVIDGTARFVERRSPVPLLRWDELRELARGPLVAVGCHGLTHRILTALDDDEAATEVAGARTALADRLAMPPASSFCYPVGRFGAREQALVAAAGFRAAISVQAGVNDASTSRFALRRTMISGYDSPAQARAKIAGALDEPSALRRALGSSRFAALRRGRRPSSGAEVPRPG